MRHRRRAAGDSLLTATAISKQLALPGDRARFNLHEVSLELMAGSLTAIVGHSGSGKTTLLQICGLLTRPDHGTLQILDHDVLRMSSRQAAHMRQTGIGFIFQSFNLAPQLGAMDNVTLNARLPSRAANRRALGLLTEFGLSRQLHHRPAELSAGEQQRVAFAWAMMNAAPIILADEPTGNLDADNEIEMIRQFKAYADAGNAVLIVTHSDTVAAHADVVLRMKNGLVLT